MSKQFAIGQTYPQGGGALRILSRHGEGFLLEKWVDDAFIQYVVTSRLFLDTGELHWRGNGAYFTPHISGRTPFEELCNATQHLRQYG